MAVAGLVMDQSDSDDRESNTGGRLGRCGLQRPHPLYIRMYRCMTDVGVFMYKILLSDMAQSAPELIYKSKFSWGSMPPYPPSLPLG